MNIGERAGDYEIVEILGAGGMGKVFKVRNVISDRVEAMKVLLPNLEGDKGLADRFLREIKVQAALDHPNIARLHTAQVYNNQLLMVMEYVEGATIEKLLGYGTIGVGDAISYAAQVLDALDYAHARGVIHRDIKPANIIRASQGTVKLMDFGIARMQTDRRLTQTGHTVGSLYYMSPEQIKGGQPDPRSDLYSLGITLYEMVTRRKPFAGDSDFSIMAAHLEQIPVAPIEVIPGIPPQLSDIIVTALAKDPGARFQSAQAMRSALLSVVPTTPQGASHTMIAPGVTAPANARPQTVWEGMPTPQPFAAQPPPVPQGVPPAMPPPVMAQQGNARPPVPPPYAAPAVPPPYAAPKKSSGMRGLYMALGSVATIGVIIAAIVMVPKFRQADAKDPLRITDPVTGSTKPAHPPVALDPPASTTPVSTPSPTPPGTTPPGGSSSIGGRPVGGVAKLPPSGGAGGKQTGGTQPAPGTSQGTTTPVQVQVQIQTPTTVQTQVPGGQAIGGQAPGGQAPGNQVPGNQAPGAPGSIRPEPPEIVQLRETYNMVAIRAGSSKSGLRTMEQQMRRQGLDMRGDMIEAESRMDYLMKESMDSIRAGDVAGGRRNLQMAERSLETIEKFLGR